MRRGEAFTDARLAGASLLVGSEGLVAAPVRIADAASVALLAPGDRVDVLAAPEAAGGSAATASASDDGAKAGGLVVPGAVVLAVPASAAGAGSPTDALDGALVTLAVSPAQASALAIDAVASRLSFVLEAPSGRQGRGALH